MLAVIAFFWAAFRKPKMIPGRTQSLGELAILAVRDQVLRPALGKKGDSYLPYIASLFFLILVMQLMELIPVLQFPVMSRIGFVWPLVVIMYVLYWYLGFKAKGFFGYFRSWIPAGPVADPDHPDPGRDPQVRRRPAVHPGRPAVREHVRRAPAADDLHARDLVPGEPVVGLLYAAGSLFMVFFVFLLEILVDLLQAFIFTTLIPPTSRTRWSTSTEPRAVTRPLHQQVPS